MKLLTQQDIPRPGNGEVVFRMAIWGTLFALLFSLSGLLAGIAFFIYSYRSSSIWGMVLAGIYTLLLGGLCQVIFLTLKASRSPANWLARIGPDGLLLKYRSYLHGESPAEDPIALQLSWPEMVAAQLQQEIHTTTDIDGRRQERRWFLAITLDPRAVDTGMIQSALEFESQRQPAHFKVDGLQRELYKARKSKAAAAEISRIEEKIAQEKRRHPGKHSKLRFHHRPVVFIRPDRLKVEWTHVTPGRKQLLRLLSSYLPFVGDGRQEFDIEQPLSEAEFKAWLITLLSRGERVEAVKLVRLQLGLNITAAKAYIEKIPPAR